MERNDYLAEIARFKATLTALDCTHRLNGHPYTPAEILSVRRAIGTLEQLVEVGLYDLKKQQTSRYQSHQDLGPMCQSEKFNDFVLGAKNTKENIARQQIEGFFYQNNRAAL